MEASSARFANAGPSSWIGREVEALATTRQRDATNWGTGEKTGYNRVPIASNTNSPDGAISS